MTRRRKPRSLLQEEIELWHEVAKSAQPLHPLPALPIREDETPKAPPKTPQRRIDPFRLGERAPNTGPRHDLAPSISDRLRKAPVQMDRKSFTRMTRGKLDPEARIDLHGMTLFEAHPALNRFIQDAHAAQKRLVLVITGKGRRGEDSGPIPQRPGILKHQVPQWLALPPLGAMVLQVSEAHIRHGGTGAYYVYLRRSR